ncbi:MAG: sigma-70 family RNA polymerase sigma factor [Anaerolineae bacterium]|nr:sigma-70 family RNA polymerase sigma factor [Anaerolineae bacterium]
MDHSLTLPAGKRRLRERPAVKPSVFARIYEDYFDRIYSFVRYQVAADADADDVTAIVFERILTGINRFDPKRGDFTGWVFGIARNTLREYYRQRRAQSSIDWQRLEQIKAPGQLPEQVIARQEENHRLLDAVARLSEREREILALKFGAGLTNRAIAKVADLSESNVGTILYRSLRRLRGLLGEESSRE